MIPFTYRLDVSIEKEGLTEDDKPKPFMDEVKRNLSEIKEALQVKEYYSLILFKILSALVVPSFGSFGYFFMLDVVQLSKFTLMPSSWPHDAGAQALAGFSTPASLTSM